MGLIKSVQKGEGLHYELHYALVISKSISKSGKSKTVYLFIYLPNIFKSVENHTITVFLIESKKAIGRSRELGFRNIYQPNEDSEINII